MENQKDGQELVWSLPLWSQRGECWLGEDTIDLVSPACLIYLNMLQLNNDSPSKTITIFIKYLT